MSIKGRPDYPTIEMANHADAFILVYNNTSRESFNSIIRFNDMVSSLPVMAVSQSPKISREKSSGIINPDTQSKSAWRRLLGSWRQSSSKRRADTITSQSVPQQGTGPDMNAGPIPKIIICNHSAEKLNVVSREEGIELVKRLGTPFYMISTQIPGWGDRDILERLILRLMYRRACGEEKARAMGGKLRSSFTAWSRFDFSIKKSSNLISRRCNEDMKSSLVVLYLLHYSSKIICSLPIPGVLLCYRSINHLSRYSSSFISLKNFSYFLPSATLSSNTCGISGHFLTLSHSIAPKSRSTSQRSSIIPQATNRDQSSGLSGVSYSGRRRDDLPK